MSVTKEKARDLRKQRKPVFGWVEEEPGHFVGPENFSEDLYLSPWFEEWAERESASYSPVEYVRTVIAQHLRRRRSKAKEPAQHEEPA